MNRSILKKLPALFAILAVACGVHVFTSCSSDDGGSPDVPQVGEQSSSSWAQTEISSSSEPIVVEPSSSSVQLPSSSSAVVEPTWSSEQKPSSSSFENPTPSSALESPSSSSGVEPTWSSSALDPTSSSVAELPSSSSGGLLTGLKQFGVVDVYMPVALCLTVKKEDLPQTVLANSKGCYYLGKYPGYNLSGSQVMHPSDTSWVGPYMSNSGPARDGKYTKFVNETSTGHSLSLCGGVGVAASIEGGDYMNLIPANHGEFLKFNDPCIEQ